MPPPPTAPLLRPFLHTSSRTATRLSLRSVPLSSPSSSRPSSSISHILHPTTRQRLTNLTFYLCALVSIATVSLTMSGSIGDGKTLGCPARGRVGAGAEEEEEQIREMRNRELLGKAQGKGKASRWLEDPSENVGEEKEVWRAGKDGRLVKVTTPREGDRQFESVRQEQKATTRIEERTGKERKKEGGIAWRDWVGLGGSSGSAADGAGTGTRDGGRVV